MAVLAWALDVAPLPLYDEVVDAPKLAHALGLWKSRSETVLCNPKLRPLSELQQFADTMLSLHWRLRQFRLTPEPFDWIEQNKTAWFGPLDISQLRFNGNDLEIGGLPLAQADEEDVQIVSSITAERHTAALWLIGSGAVYSEVSTDT